MNLTKEQIKEIKWVEAKDFLKIYGCKFYVSDDGKYVKRQFVTAENYLFLMGQDFIELLRSKGIIPSWLFFHIEEKFTISEFHPEQYKNQVDIKPEEYTRFKVLLRELWSIDTSLLPHSNRYWLNSAYFRHKSSFLKILGLEYMPLFDRFKLQYAFTRAERVLRSMNEKFLGAVISNNITFDGQIGVNGKDVFLIDLTNLNVSPIHFDEAAFKNNIGADVKFGEDITSNNMRFVHAFITWLKLFSMNEEERNIQENWQGLLTKYNAIWEEFLLVKRPLKMENVELSWGKNNGGIFEWYKEIAKVATKSTTFHNYVEVMVFHFYWTREIFIKNMYNLEIILRKNISSLKNVFEPEKFFRVAKKILPKSAKWLDPSHKKWLEDESIMKLIMIFKKGDWNSLMKLFTPENYIRDSVSILKKMCNDEEIVEILEYVKYNDFSVDIEHRLNIAEYIKSEFMEN